MIRALTTYINDDPAARAWLNGKPDPWGMVVNPAYRHIDAAGRQVAAAEQVRAEGLLRLRSERLPVPQPGPVPAAGRGTGGVDGRHQRGNAVRDRSVDDGVFADRRHDGRRETREGRPADRRVPLHDRRDVPGRCASLRAVERPHCKRRADASSRPTTHRCVRRLHLLQTRHVDRDVARADQGDRYQHVGRLGLSRHDGGVRGHSDHRSVEHGRERLRGIAALRGRAGPAARPRRR